MLEVTSVTSYFPSRSAGETIHRSPKGQEERHASLSQSRAERRAGREAAARGCWGAGEEGERERAWNWAAVPSEIMGACWKRKMQIHIPAEHVSILALSLCFLICEVGRRPLLFTRRPLQEVLLTASPQPTLSCYRSRLFYKK